jgi:hypothetical protein
MRSITVRLPDDAFSTMLATMSEWLDRHRYEPIRFKYHQDEDAVIVSVEFSTEAAAREFARRFGG